MRKISEKNGFVLHFATLPNDGLNKRQLDPQLYFHIQSVRTRLFVLKYINKI